jgi:quercetin dioxygenase-like cupin family protein
VINHNNLYDQIQVELDHALSARAEGNEGKARVCARRAAGIAAGEYLKSNGYPDPGPSAYDRLKYLCEISRLPGEVNRVAAHFMIRVTPDHTLPLDIDLISEARWLVEKLLDRDEQGDTMPLPYQFMADLAGEIPSIPEDSIISRTFYSDDEIKAILFGFATGQELSEHTASTPAILYFISGEADLTLGGDPQKAQPGTWVHMDARLPHSVKAKTPVTMLLLLVQNK